MFETAADYECADQWRTGYVNTPRGGDCVTNTQGLGFGRHGIVKRDSARFLTQVEAWQFF